MSVLDLEPGFYQISNLKLEIRNEMTLEKIAPGGEALPGQDLISAGVCDLQEGRETIAALLVAIGAPRVLRIGI